MKFIKNESGQAKQTSPRALRVEQRAQAALVDSLFFTAIVAAICAGLFYFVIYYGTSSEALLNAFYSSDFAMDSLKVITYINVLRDGRTISDNYVGDYPEYDYLLALIKEDYAQNNDLTKDTKTAIANTVHSVLCPFEDSVDYVFFIIKESAVPGQSKFLALIMAAHQRVPASSTDPDPNCISGECFTSKRVFYSCAPTITNVLEKSLFPVVGKIDSAYGKITLNGSPYVMGLSTWVSKDLNVLKEIEQNSDFTCIVLDVDPEGCKARARP